MNFINFFLATGLIYGFSTPAIMPEFTTTISAEKSEKIVKWPKIEPKTQEVWVTAYSSVPEETDDSPFITASNKRVRKGILAANFLKFGAKVKIPDIFGEEIFTVEDRMHPRKHDFVDIWMPSKKEAQQFGISRAKIIIIEDD